MIIHNVDQGSNDWHVLRLGIPTASEFNNIITPAKGQATTGKCQEKYLHKLLCQRQVKSRLEKAIAAHAGSDGDKPTLESVVYEMGPDWVNEIFGTETQWMREGREFEQEAADTYTLVTGYETEKVGFITNDEGTAGCSLDRYRIQTPEQIAVQGGKRWAVEIKKHLPHIHSRYVSERRLEIDKRPQVQCQNWIANLAGVDIVSYCRNFDPPIIIAPSVPKEDYISEMRKHQTLFSATLDAEWRKVKGDTNNHEEKD